MSEVEELVNYKSPLGRLVKELEIIAKKPQLDDRLGQILDQFWKLLQNADLQLDKGVIFTGFVESSLLLQIAASLYTKKVDLLFDSLISYQERNLQYEKKEEQVKTVQKLNQLMEKSRQHRSKKVEVTDTKRITFKFTPEQDIRGLLDEFNKNYEENPVQRDRLPSMGRTRRGFSREILNRNLLDKSDPGQDQVRWFFEDMHVGPNCVLSRRYGEVQEDNSEVDDAVMIKNVIRPHQIFQSLLVEHDLGFVKDSQFIDSTRREMVIAQEYLMEKNVESSTPRKKYKKDLEKFEFEYYNKMHNNDHYINSCLVSDNSEKIRQSSEYFEKVRKQLFSLYPTSITKRSPSRLDKKLELNARRLEAANLANSISTCSVSQQENTSVSNNLTDLESSISESPANEICPKSIGKSRDPRLTTDSGFFEDSDHDCTISTMNTEELELEKEQTNNETIEKEVVAPRTKILKVVLIPCKVIEKKKSKSSKRKILELELDEEDEAPVLKKRKLSKRALHLLTIGILTCQQTIWEKFHSQNYISDQREGEVVQIDSDEEDSMIDDSPVRASTPLQPSEATLQPETPRIILNDPRLRNQTPLPLAPPPETPKEPTVQTRSAEDDFNEMYTKTFFEQQDSPVIEEWKTKIIPIIRKLDGKEFDIHELGSQVMDSMQINETKTFKQLTNKKKTSDAVRIFISCLQLANTENIHISGVQKNAISNDTLSFTLLKRDRYHEHLTDFAAPSTSGLTKRRKIH